MLEEVGKLPETVVENLRGDMKNLKVYLVQDFNLDLLKSMVNLSSEIFGESGTGEWSLVPQIRHGNVFVLKEEGQKSISGVAILMRDWEDVDKAYLFEYAIAEDFQGYGLGYHFLYDVCQDIREQGFKRLSLTVDVQNIPAIKLYQDKLGFRIVEMNKNEYGLGHNRFIMELELADLPALQ